LDALEGLSLIGDLTFLGLAFLGLVFLGLAFLGFVAFFYEADLDFETEDFNSF
jgi:hypothetical protein